MGYMSITSIRPDGRLAWADLAKAACIVLVVLYHVLKYEHPMIAWNWSAAVEGWQWVSVALRPLRMPTFFLISGMMAATSLNRPWEVVKSKRVDNLFYLYFLWAAVFLVFFEFGPGPQWINGWPFMVRLTSALAGTSSAWYLFALPAFITFSWKTKHLDWRIPLGLTFVLAVLADTIMAGDALWAWRSMARSMFFFVVGVRLPSVVMFVAERTTLF